MYLKNFTRNAVFADVLLKGRDDLHGFLLAPPVALLLALGGRKAYLRRGAELRQRQNDTRGCWNLISSNFRENH